jgi:hypothetical protein
VAAHGQYHKKNPARRMHSKAMAVQKAKMLLEVQV